MQAGILSRTMLSLWFLCLILKPTIKAMKNIWIILTILLLVSCEERNPGYFNDITGVYFNNTSGSLSVTDSLDLTFVYQSGDIMEVPVRIQLVGRTSLEDRALSVTVESDNAVEGTDYLLPENPVLPAGASYTDYMITLMRTDALKRERKMIRLDIHENECFALPVTEIVQLDDTVSTLELRIYFSDMFTKAPVAWDENLVGKFTQQKFELICKVLDIDPADFNDPGVITLAKLLYISSEMTAYVQSEVEKRTAGEPYDEEAFDAETDEPLTFRR